MKKIIALILLNLTVFIAAQVKVKGTVVDESGNPMSYIDVAFKGTEERTVTDDKGNFYLESSTTHPKIVASLIGFKDVEVVINKGFQKIEIKFGPYIEDDTIVDSIPNPKPSVPKKNVGGITNAKDVVITYKKVKYKTKKENPAYTIMRKLWEKRRDNGLDKAKSYEYEKYEKIEFDMAKIDSQFMKKKILFKDFEFIFEKIDTSRITGEPYLPMFLNETISKVYGLKDPKKIREDRVANKISGFKNTIALTETLKNLYLDFNIYDNTIILFNKAFASPLATNGFSLYEYHLADSLIVNNKKIYRIKYYPKNKSDLAFKGNFYVVEDAWAVQKIDMQSTKEINVNFVNNVYLEQEYEIKNDSIFVPKQQYTMLDMSLISKNDHAKGMYAHKTVYFNKILLDAPKTTPFYDIKTDPFDFKETEKPDEYWNKNRPLALNKNESGIYETLDRLEKTPRFNRLVNMVDIITSGYFNITKNIKFGNMYQTIGFNEIEGTRLRIGLATFKNYNDRISVKAYLAYGTQDEKFKYGAETKYLLSKNTRWIIGGGNKNDIMQLGAQLIADEGIITRSFGSSSLFTVGSNNRLSSVKRTNIFSSIELTKNFVLRFDGTYQITKSAHDLFNADFYQDGVRKSELTDTHFALTFEAQPGKKYSGNGVERYSHNRVGAYPTIVLKYSKGMKDVIDSDFAYNKFDFLYNQPILINSLGEINATFGLGITEGVVPITLLNITTANQSLGYVPNTFAMMNYYEFVADNYATLHLEHHLGGRLFSRIPLLKKLKLREIFFIRAASGNLSKDNLEMIADDNLRNDIKNYSFQNNKPYVEYGFGIENIGLGNFRMFRFDFNWRGNYLENPQARKFGVKFGFSVGF